MSFVLTSSSVVERLTARLVERSGVRILPSQHKAHQIGNLKSSRFYVKYRIQVLSIDNTPTRTDLGKVIGGPEHKKIA